MRVASGKGNDARKILTYYRVNFGLQAPYKVLCDGALIHQALIKKLYLRDALPALLGSSARPVVTRCVHEELRGLGETTVSAALFAKRLNRVPCAHEDGIVPAAECVVAAVRGGNEKTLLVATNDGGLLRQIRKEAGVPVIRIIGEGKFALVPPAKATLDKVAEQEGFKVGVQRPDEVKLLEEEKQRIMKLRAERKEARATLKRKRPKGPNPLSVKKSKKAKPCGANSAPPSEEKEDMEAVNETWNDDPSEDTEASRDMQTTNDKRSKPKRVRRRKPKPARKPAFTISPETIEKDDIVTAEAISPEATEKDDTVPATVIPLEKTEKDDTVKY